MRQRQSILSKKQMNNEQNNPKDKIEYLHKMLDNEIQTVNNLFMKDNAFQKIEAKLKNLQVKLNSIKDQNSVLNTQFVNFHKNDNKFKMERLSIGRESSIHQEQIKQHPNLSNLPFETLSHYKKSKKKELTNQTSSIRNQNSNKKSNKSSQKYFESGRKLNFDLSQSQNEQNKTELKKNKHKSSKKIVKTKSQNYIGIESKKRSKSTNPKYFGQEQQNKNNSKLLTRQNSSKKKKVSISKSEKAQNFMRKNSNMKKVSQRKSPNKEVNWKNLINVYSKTNLKQKQVQMKNEEEKRREKLKQIVRKGQQKRLQKQLANFKVQNQNLQSQVRQLKGYKQQFQRLKQVFSKQQRIRKNRRKL